jgi:hypothetical protein
MAALRRKKGFHHRRLSARHQRDLPDVRFSQTLDAITMLLSLDTTSVPNVPIRQFVPMEVQPIVPWTPVRLVRSAWYWLIAQAPRQMETDTARS